jgi:hypothetical protein
MEPARGFQRSNNIQMDGMEAVRQHFHVFQWGPDVASDLGLLASQAALGPSGHIPVQAMPHKEL